MQLKRDRETPSSLSLAPTQQGEKTPNQFLSKQMKEKEDER
jgi:hypothetical protein